jgi:hypothetical protein
MASQDPRVVLRPFLWRRGGGRREIDVAFGEARETLASAAGN